jgi:PAS domain S-box-containing protein
MMISANAPTFLPARSALSDAILDLLEFPVFAVDPAGKVVSWNQAAAAATGVAAAEIIGQSFANAVLLEEDIHTWESHFSRILAGSSPISIEQRWKVRHGSAAAVSSSSAMIRDSAGEIAFVVFKVTGGAGDLVAGGFESPSQYSQIAELMRDRLAERRELSTFLHATIAQNLVALSLNISILQTTLPTSAATSSANRTLETIERCCRDVRVISYMLAPPVAGAARLDTLIESYLDCLRDEAELEISARIEPVPDGISPDVQSLFMAVVQEWTARAIRNCPRADLSIRLSHGRSAANGRSELVLELDAGGPGAMLDGWTIFRERVHALGGHFEVSGCRSRSRARMAVSEWGA